MKDVSDIAHGLRIEVGDRIRTMIFGSHHTFKSIDLFSDRLGTRISRSTVHQLASGGIKRPRARHIELIGEICDAPKEEIEVLKRLCCEIARLESKKGRPRTNKNQAEPEVVPGARRYLNDTIEVLRRYANHSQVRSQIVALVDAKLTLITALHSIGADPWIELYGIDLILAEQCATRDQWIRTRTLRAELLLRQGSISSAARELSSLINHLSAGENTDQIMVARVRERLCVALLADGGLEEADREMRSALGALRQALGSSHPEVLSVWRRICRLLVEAKDTARATLEYDALLVEAGDSLSRTDLWAIRLRYERALFLQSAGDPAGAERELEAIVHLCLDYGDMDLPELEPVLRAYCELLLRKRDPITLIGIIAKCVAFPPGLNLALLDNFHGYIERAGNIL